MAVAKVAILKWMVWAVVAVIGMTALLALVGYFLPVSHEASRSADFNTPPEAVYALISDVQNYSSWWPENDVAVEVVDAVRPTRLVTRIVGESAFGGTWTWNLEKTSAGSRATITERGEIYNPIFRALAKLVFGYTSSMDSCLAAAQRRLGT